MEPPTNLTEFPTRLPGENTLWYKRFCTFILLKKRSVLALHTAERAARGLPPTRTCPASWLKKVTQYQWYARAEAWDKTELQRKAAELADQRQAWRETELAAAHTLVKKAQEALKIPLLTATLPNGSTIKGDPGAVRVGLQCFTDASTLARRALEMTERRIAVEQLTDAEILHLLDLTEPVSPAQGSAEAGIGADAEL